MMRLFSSIVLGIGVVLVSWTAYAADAQVAANKDGGKTDPNPAISDAEVQEWVQKLEDKDRKVRYAAVAALAKAGPGASKAVPALKKMQQDTDPYNQSLANYALAYVQPDPAINSNPADLLLVMKAKDKPPATKSIAAANLAKLGPAASKVAYDELVGLLKTDPDSYTRALAAYVLPYLKPMSGDSALTLAEALKDKHKDVARTAAASLVTLGDNASSATAAVVALLQDKEAYRRALAAYVLGNIGADPKSAGPALLKATKDMNENVKQAAREALKKVDPVLAKQEGIQ